MNILRSKFLTHSERLFEKQGVHYFIFDLFAFALWDGLGQLALDLSVLVLLTSRLTLHRIKPVNGIVSYSLPLSCFSLNQPLLQLGHWSDIVFYVNRLWCLHLCMLLRPLSSNRQHYGIDDCLEDNS